jgi:hypothetical protein
MTLHFLRGGRDQRFLLRPDRRDWLPTGHLAWFSLDAVDQVDRDRSPGGGRAAGGDRGDVPEQQPDPSSGAILSAR